MSVKNIKLSIVIPIYNTEPHYIQRLLDSIKICANIEIIIVNDASTNKETLDYLNKVSKNKLYKIINNKTNIGLGPTRNVGFSNANGEYIWFVDSDDYLNKDAINIVLNLLKSCDYEIISINFFNDYSNKKIKNSDTDYNFQFDNVIIYGKATVWSKIYSRSFLLKNNIYHFNNNMFHEDEYFTFKCLYFMKKITNIEKPLYFYNKINDSSITKNLKNDVSYDHFFYLLKSFIEEFNIKNIKKNKLLFKYMKTYELYEVHFLLKNNISFNKFYNFWKLTSFLNIYKKILGNKIFIYIIFLIIKIYVHLKK